MAESESKYRVASRDWIGQAVRFTWGGESASEDVGLVTDYIEELLDPARPDRVTGRLMVWWPEAGSCSSHPGYQLRPVEGE